MCLCVSLCTDFNPLQDHAASRYIFTKMNPVARLIYPETDDALYKYQTDDNKKVEPEMYVPIVPMVLINGSAGIGTGWSTNMPNHDIRKCIANVKKMINGDEPDGQFKPVIIKQNALERQI